MTCLVHCLRSRACAFAVKQRAARMTKMPMATVQMTADMSLAFFPLVLMLPLYAPLSTAHLPMFFPHHRHTDLITGLPRTMMVSVSGSWLPVGELSHSAMHQRSDQLDVCQGAPGGSLTPVMVAAGSCGESALTHSGITGQSSS